MADAKRPAEKPASAPPFPGLEIHEDLHYQHMAWRAERIGWAVMALFVLAGLLGLFGSGRFSQATATAADGRLDLTFERFTRVDSSTRLVIRFRGPGPEAGLELGHAVLEGIRVETLIPPPLRVELHGDRYRYWFANGAPGEPAEVVLRFRHERAGTRGGRVGLVGGSHVAFTQLVYP